MHTPFLSIIAPDFEDSVSPTRFENFIFSVLSQYHDDWELFIIHDGKRKKPLSIHDTYLKDPRIKFLESNVRFNDWGHTLRDMGAKEASGEYLLFCNADNVLYEHCLSLIYSFSRKKYSNIDFINNSDNRIHSFNPSNKVILYGIKMRGNVHHSMSSTSLRQKGFEFKYSTILSGAPPLPTQVDAMQMCCKREVFMELGGWHDKLEDSDGRIISKICASVGYSVIPEILGEHW